MCKLIAELVGSDEQIVREMISRLEYFCGQPGVDIRVSGEIYASANMKMRSLGLDPRDTTPEELYEGLTNLASLHDRFLKQHFGISDKASSRAILEQTTHIINRLKLHRQAWLLRPAVAKRILKQNAPKQLMKLLNYRSLDSMLKRELPEVLIPLAVRVENSAWLKQLHKNYLKLVPSDFEIKTVGIQYLDPKRYQDVADYIAKKHHTPVVSSVEMGSVLVLPIDTFKTRGLTLLTSLLALRSLNDIRLYSTFLKFNQVHADFGKLLVETLYKGKTDHIKLVGQPVHWRVVHNFYGGGDKNHPEIFEPHVQADDLAYRKAEEILYRLEPALHFWHNLDYVGLPQPSGAISFNLVDVALNLVNRIPYNRRINHHLRDALWCELYARYLAQPSHEQQLLSQLDEKVTREVDFEAAMFVDLELFV